MSGALSREAPRPVVNGTRVERHELRHELLSSVFGCGPPGKMVAGAKGGDTCYWTTATNDDQVAAQLDALTIYFMQSNVCRRRQLEWSLARADQRSLAEPHELASAARAQSQARSDALPPSCDHLPNFWSACAPRSVAEGRGEARLTQPGFAAGCVVEGLLSLAIERSDLGRLATPSYA
jgi:hypothetical protein